MNKDDFFELCSNSLARLTRDEEQALMAGMSDAEIDAAREAMLVQYSMTLEQGLEANASRPGGLLDQLSERFGCKVDHLTAKEMARACGLAQNFEKKSSLERLAAIAEMRELIGAR